MSNKPTKFQILEQIEKICVVEARELLDCGFTQQSLTSLVLGIEWLGGILDGKPIGAKSQSRKRFELVLKHLPPEYWSSHLDYNLYRQLRNKAVHNPWVDSQYLEFTDREDRHLELIDSKRLFSISRLITDLESVILKLKKNQNFD